MQVKHNFKDLSDDELIEGIVSKNDTLLFEMLYDRYAKLVYNKCYGFASSIHEAEDLTQDVFLKLFVKLKTFKGKSKFSTWLYAFTYNHCVNYVTRNNSKKIEKQSVTTDNIGEDSYDPDVDDNSISMLKVEKLKEALELISPDERMILLLKYQDFLSIKELAEILELGESAVKMRLKRAKEKLINVYNDVDHE